jgi:hypothetical protein
MAMLFSLCAGPVMAMDLYIAEAPLASASEADLKLAKRQAMASMIVRLTGQQASLKQAPIKAALAEVDNYISHISRQTDTATEEVVLQLRFDQQAVRQLLSAADLPLWVTDRSSILTWLVIEQQGIQDIIADGGLDIALQLQAEAEQRGLPLILPLMDLTDQLLIGPSDIWGNFTDTIAQASQRYQAHGLLWGRLYKNSDGFWQGQGSIQLPDERREWLFAAATPEALVALIVENLGAQLSQRFALPTATDQQHTATLHINGINDLAAYAALRKILQALASVNTVTLQRLHAEKLVVLVNYQGHQDNLLLSLEGQTRLQLLDGQSETLYSAKNGLVAYYQWH